MAETTETNVLDRVLEPFSRCFTPEVAQKVADFRTDAVMQARLDELAEKANEGSLSETETAEYDSYIEAIDFIAILQAKARSLLGQPNS
jgi:hypothetical protein